MICYYQFGMQNQLLLLTPHKIKDSRYSNKSRYPELHGLFRLLNTACRLRGYMQQAFPLLSEYDIIIVPSMAEEPMALTCLTGNPCITLPAGIAAAGVVAKHYFHRW
jgi:hypothetical protein